MPTYYTHYNGRRPFRVDIEDDGKVHVYKYENTLKQTFHPNETFVGTSWENVPNSFLLHMGNLRYIYIGERIREFKSTVQITTYKSPIGNNDVPYPFAIDSNKNFYLIIEKVIVQHVPRGFEYEPYRWYYKMCKMTPELSWNGRHPSVSVDDMMEWDRTNISEWHVGDEMFVLNYDPEPAEDYDRLLANAPDEDKCMYIVTKESHPNKVKLTRENYIDLLTAYGEKQGFRPIVQF